MMRDVPTSENKLSVVSVRYNSSLMTRVHWANVVQRKIVLIKINIFIQPLCQAEVFLGKSELRRALCGCYCLVETGVLGISGGQCPEEKGALPAGEFIRFSCQLERFGAVSQRRIRTGGEQPGKIV